MKHLIIPIILTSVGIFFAGCQTNTPASIQVNQQMIQPSSSPKPSSSPNISSADQEAEDPDMKVIQTELEKLNTETDFPTFTEKDLQQ